MSRSHPRRTFIQATAAAIATVPFSAAVLNGQSARPRNAGDSLIARENQKPGDHWQLARVRMDQGVRGRKGTRSPWIEGYCSHQSIQAGETLEVMVSTNPARAFMLEVFRMGYYGGKGARRVTTIGPTPGHPQPVPSEGKGRVRECTWEPSLKIVIPPDWLSGVYLGRLTTVPDNTREPYWQSFVVFIVRDNRPAEVLFQCSDNTWEAYNPCPDAYSMYTHPEGPEASEVAISFDRPYARYPQIIDNPLTVGSGEFLLWEYPLCYWLEQHGYDVTYCSNHDLLTPDRALQCRVMLSQGHDEYWDLRQYASVRRVIDEGVTVLFLAGNAIVGVTPFSPSSDGRPDRIIAA